MCQLDACRRVHEKIHDKKNYKCEHCSYATTDNFRLKIHLKKEHGMEDEEIQDKINSKKKPTGPLTTPVELPKVLNINTVPCDECEQSFTSASSLERHIKLVHDNLKEFKCQDCDYAANVREDLLVHMKVQLNKYPILDFNT